MLKGLIFRWLILNGQTPVAILMILRRKIMKGYIFRGFFNQVILVVKKIEKS